jgi:polysaccharide pyruvyl transferase WcaK-like protein/SAM-dependent methyltransferase
MIVDRLRGRRRRAGGPRRIGLFGLLGSGNLGNDGSLEAVLEYLAAEHPDAELTSFCAGPERVSRRYGVDAVPLHWYDETTHPASGAAGAAFKAIGKALDAFRTAAWVRTCDLVIVPGMGVLEASVPLRPWGFPYAMFLLGAAGRLTGTDVALVGVGSEVVPQRVTRGLIVRAARLAAYRSYRDEPSRDAMRAMGVDVAADGVYSDLAFSLPTPDGDSGSTGVVGVGVMAYYGGNADRGRADEIHATYRAAMERFVGWLVDGGRRVRLFTGDGVDTATAEAVAAGVRRRRPGLDAAAVVVEATSTLDQLMDRMRDVDAVVATRYHNVVCALKLAKPTLSVGYAAKNAILMAEMGVGQYVQSVLDLDVDRLVEQFVELERDADRVRSTLRDGEARQRKRLDEQFAELSARFFHAAGGAGRPAPQTRGARMGAVNTAKTTLRRAEGKLQRALATVGAVQGEARIAGDAQAYWTESDGKRWRSESHWRDADAFAANDVWSAIGRRHLEMVESGARSLGVEPRWDRVLEWGCGGGANAVHFAPRAGEFIGVEVSAETVAECGRQVAAVCDTPFRPVLVDVADPESAVEQVGGPVDLFLCTYVFELIPTPEYGARLLRIAQQLLAPGGLAMVQIKYDDGRWSSRPRRRAYRTGVAEMTTYGIAPFWELAQRCGLTPHRVELVPRDELDERYAYFLLSRP